jgi:hypothetical protein
MCAVVGKDGWNLRASLLGNFYHEHLIAHVILAAVFYHLKTWHAKKVGKMPKAFMALKFGPIGCALLNPYSGSRYEQDAPFLQA